MSRSSTGHSECGDDWQVRTDTHHKKSQQAKMKTKGRATRPKLNAPDSGVSER